MGDNEMRGVSYEGLRPEVLGEEKRVALVIGNSNYAHAEPLTNPINDASSIASTLRELGFRVEEGLDLDLIKMGDSQEIFEQMLGTGADVALLFYAGHGLQVNGKNYLIPIDAKIDSKPHLSRAIRFDDLLDSMSQGARANLVFLDACRNNPFTRNLTRTMDQKTRSLDIREGLAKTEKVEGAFISYSTAPDMVAFDGEGKNSPYTRALLKYIHTPRLSVSDMMIEVRNEVATETSEKQIPWEQSSLRARFFFVQDLPEELMRKEDNVNSETLSENYNTTSKAEMVSEQQEQLDKSKETEPPDIQQSSESKTQKKFEEAKKIWEKLQHSADIKAIKEFIENYPIDPWRIHASLKYKSLTDNEASSDSVDKDVLNNQVSENSIQITEDVNIARGSSRTVSKSRRRKFKR